MGRGHGSANCVEDQEGVGSGPVMAVGYYSGVRRGRLVKIWNGLGVTAKQAEECLHDILQAVYISVPDGIHVQKVMLHECDAAICEHLGVFFRSDDVLALFKDWASVLDHEFQSRIE